MSVCRELGELAAELTKAYAEVLKYKLELEACSLKKWSAGVLSSLLMLVTAFVVVLAGLGFILGGCYSLLSSVMEPWLAAVALGGALLLVSLILFGMSKH